MLSERTGTEMCINQCVCVCVFVCVCISVCLHGFVCIWGSRWGHFYACWILRVIVVLSGECCAPHIIERAEEEMPLCVYVCVCVCVYVLRWRTSICCSMCGQWQKKCPPKHNQHPSEARLTSPTDKRLNASLNHSLFFFSLLPLSSSPPLFPFSHPNTSTIRLPLHGSLPFPASQTMPLLLLPLPPPPPAGGRRVWPGDELHHPGGGEHRLHGGAAVPLRGDVPGWDLEHVYRHPPQERAQPADQHRGRPHPAGAAQDEHCGRHDRR